MYDEEGAINIPSEPQQQNQQNEAVPGVSPEDVQFNLLAGNEVNPSYITDEERKMIEQALRDSEQQELQHYRDHRTARANVQDARAEAHNARQAMINPRQNLSEQEQQMEMVARSEGLHRDKNAIKAAKKADKKGANK